MRASIIVPAFMAASAFAAPAVHVVTKITHVTLTVTAGQGYPVAPTPAPQPVVVTAVENIPAPAPTPEAQPEPQPEPQPAPAPPAPVSAPADPNSQEGILEVVNKWRQAFSLGEQRWSQKLADNAEEVGRNGRGVNQIHILPEIDGAGKCGQVITPGSDYHRDGYGDLSPFEIAYVSWLCEHPTSQTQALCPQVVSANAMSYNTVAHYEELVDPDYTQVGCAFFANPDADPSVPWNGLWTCSFESE